MIKFVGNPEIIDNSLYELGTLEECISWLSNKQSIGLDTETEGFFDHKNKIVMLQLYSPIDDIAYVIDTRYNDISRLTILQNMLILGQNLKFDYKFLKFHGIVLENIYDTFLAECCLTNGLKDRELSLEALARKYCSIKLDKTIRNQFINLHGQPFTNNQITYGVGDVSCLFKIKEQQDILIKERQLENVIFLENKACLALADIEYTGMYLNAAEWLKLAEKAESGYRNYESELDDMVRQEPKLSRYVSKEVQGNLFVDVEEGFEHGRDIMVKWSSNAQVLRLFNTLGLELESVEERFISKYQSQYPLIKKYIDYKKEAKLATTYGRDFLKFINPITNRIHTNFWQILDTHRISSSEPNLQQIPAKKEYYKCFEAPEGYKIVGADFSGQELRVIAQGSQDPLWLDTFNTGKDLHGEIAAMLFNIPISEVKNKPEFVEVSGSKVYLRGKSPRDITKVFNFGLAYGMSEFKLADNLSISIGDAKVIMDNYFNAVPKVKIFLDKLANYGVKNRYIRSYKPYSIIRLLTDFNMEDNKQRGAAERRSKNTPIQATGAMMAKIAMYKIRDKIKELNYKVEVFLQVHDAIFCYVQEDYAEEWAKLQGEIMKEAGEVFIKDIPVLSDISITNCWSK